MKATLQKYLSIFNKLRVDRSHGVAPHKPVLLLSVLQAFRQKLYVSNRVCITPELVALFKSTWNLVVTTSHDCRISYPFYYLKSDKFWTLIPREGFEHIELGAVAKSFNSLNTAIAYAAIADDLFELMTDEYSNHILTQFLLDEYFPRAGDVADRIIKNEYRVLENIEKKILNESSEEYRKEIRELVRQSNEEEIFLRGSIFKREVPRIYDNTCCISGMRIDSAYNLSMIDACHIVPFSKSYDDTISNGISLCPNLHRAFDRGLISIGREYEVLVSEAFTEGNSDYRIRNFAGSRIRLPQIQDHWPHPDNLQWHNDNIFKRG